MHKFKVRLAGFLINAALILILLTACGGSQDAIIGRWNEPGCTPSANSNLCMLEFNKDSIIVSGITMSYSWTDNQHIKVIDHGTDYVMEVTISGDNLSLTPPLTEHVFTKTQYLERIK